MRNLLVAVAGLSACAAAQNGFQWPDGKRVAVSLSFDDARESQPTVGAPLFNRLGAKVTFYVQPPNMQKRLDGWKAIVAAGHEIGSHTSSHPCSGNFAWSRKNALEDWTMARMREELDRTNADIERMVGAKPTTFAYPCGQKILGRGLNAQTYVPLIAEKFLAGRGFRDESANNPSYVDMAQLLGIESDGMSFEAMKDAVAGNQGQWVVFAGHEIGSGGRQTTLAASLEQFIAWAKDPANGVWLDTVGNVARYVRKQRGGKP